MLANATKDLVSAPTAVSLAVIATTHDDVALTPSLATSNPFHALKDNDDSDGGV